MMAWLLLERISMLICPSPCTVLSPCRSHPSNRFRSFATIDLVPALFYPSCNGRSSHDPPVVSIIQSIHYFRHCIRCLHGSVPFCGHRACCSLRFTTAVGNFGRKSPVLDNDLVGSIWNCLFRYFLYVEEDWKSIDCESSADDIYSTLGMVL